MLHSPISCWNQPFQLKKKPYFASVTLMGENEIYFFFFNFVFCFWYNKNSYNLGPNHMDMTPCTSFFLAMVQLAILCNFIVGQWSQSTTLNPQEEHNNFILLLKPISSS